jgi:hypothetical protein
MIEIQNLFKKNKQAQTPSDAWKSFHQNFTFGLIKTIRYSKISEWLR